jgi:uncharacterized membrane protein YozB (DUF420 family)
MNSTTSTPQPFSASNLKGSCFRKPSKDAEMLYRIMQYALFIVGAVLALAALKGITEPWRQMSSTLATQVAAGYLIAAVLSIISIVAAWQFGIKAREPKDSN